MWIEPVKRISEDGSEYNLVLLDVEGADSNCIMVSLPFISLKCSSHLKIKFLIVA